MPYTWITLMLHSLTAITLLISSKKIMTNLGTKNSASNDRMSNEMLTTSLSPLTRPVTPGKRKLASNAQLEQCNTSPRAD